MENNTLTDGQLASLAALANGIIPADDRDSGAAAVDAAPKLALRIASGVNAALYRQGIVEADTVSTKQFGQPPAVLNPGQVHELIAALKQRLPGFYKQLRMDVSALYLSDPEVWERMGFPGPSTERGGYPDFDQPQL